MPPPGLGNFDRKSPVPEQGPDTAQTELRNSNSLGLRTKRAPSRSSNRHTCVLEVVCQAKHRGNALWNKISSAAIDFGGVERVWVNAKVPVNVCVGKLLSTEQAANHIEVQTTQVDTSKKVRAVRDTKITRSNNTTQVETEKQNQKNGIRTLRRQVKRGRTKTLETCSLAAARQAKHRKNEGDAISEPLNQNGRTATHLVNVWEVLSHHWLNAPQHLS